MADDSFNATNEKWVWGALDDAVMGEESCLDCLGLYRVTCWRSSAYVCSQELVTDGILFIVSSHTMSLKILGPLRGIG